MTGTRATTCASGSVKLNWPHRGQRLDRADHPRTATGRPSWSLAIAAGGDRLASGDLKDAGEKIKDVVN